MATSRRQAIENLIKAKDKLKVRHDNRCPVDMDPDYTGPCRCGASDNLEARTLIDKALDNLLGD